MSNNKTKKWSELDAGTRRLIVHKVKRSINEGMSRECSSILILLGLSTVFLKQTDANTDDLVSVLISMRDVCTNTLYYEVKNNKFDPIIAIRDALESEGVDPATDFFGFTECILQELVCEHFR